jgi:hypothetical protein
VETLVTQRIENALIGTIGLQSVRSSSIQGLSVVTIVFSDGIDIYKARQIVGERLLEITSQMPQGIAAPIMEPLTSATMAVLTRLSSLVQEAGVPPQPELIAETIKLIAFIVRTRYPIEPCFVEESGQAVSAIFREEERHREERGLCGRVFTPSESRRDPDETLSIEQPEDLMRRTFDRTLPFFRRCREPFLIGGGENAGSRPESL